MKKIDDARRALRLVHSTCVVWPNSACSQVLLAGSFDGWATQVFYYFKLIKYIYIYILYCGIEPETFS